MTPRRLIPALLLLGTALATAQGPAQAQSEQDRAREELMEGKILSYAEIVRIARRAVPGRVVGQDLMRRGAGWVYRLKIQQSGGKVAVVMLDASTGEVISVKGRR